MASDKKMGAATIFKTILLYCGIISIVWYVAINIILPLQYEGYSMVSQTVSELSAIDTPTRLLWVGFCLPFSILTIGFGYGVWLSAGQSKLIRWTGIVIIADAIIGIFWPPMHKREIIAAGGGTITDTLHIVWTFIHLVFVLLMIGFAAAASGKRFRVYSIVTVFLFFVFGILTATESPGMETGKPTPYIGIWERVNMGAYMLWVIVFAITLLKKESASGSKFITQ